MESDTDEAFVEAGEDFYHAEPPPMRAAPPVPTMMDYLLHYLSNPWVVLILAFVVYKFVYRPFWPRVAELWAVWNQRRREDRDAAEIFRNPEVYRRKMEAVDEVRKRQQERYEAAARLAAEREREKEEEKRRQRLEELENLVKVLKVAALCCRFLSLHLKLMPD